MSAPSEKKRIDWEAVEILYRAGLLSLREIAEEHGITHGAINKRAKRDGWTRNLEARIRAKADAAVSRAAVSEEVSAQKLVTERVIVEANAELQYRIRIEHRQDIGRTRKLFQNLLGELEITTDNVGLFERLGELLDESGEDENGKSRQDKLNEIYRKVISLGGRVDSSKKLIEMLEKVIRLEREAFNISGAPELGDDQGQQISNLELARRIAFLLSSGAAELTKG